MYINPISPIETINAAALLAVCVLLLVCVVQNQDLVILRRRMAALQKKYDGLISGAAERLIDKTRAEIAGRNSPEGGKLK